MHLPQIMGVTNSPILKHYAALNPRHLMISIIYQDSASETNWTMSTVTRQHEFLVSSRLNDT